MPKSISSLLRLLEWSVISTLLSPPPQFFLSSSFPVPWRHKETADHIEAVAREAVGASQQTLAFLMDLLQDNSTEEYIRNLTERWAQHSQTKHTPTRQTRAERMSPVLIKHPSLRNPNKSHDSPDHCAFCSIFQTTCTYPCITAQGLLSSLFKAEFRSKTFSHRGTAPLHCKPIAFLDLPARSLHLLACDCSEDYPEC